MSDSLFHMQAEFMEAGAVPVSTDDNRVHGMAERLVNEEYQEWANELYYGSKNDIKECLDLIYVSIQYLNVLLGPDKALECFQALHANNMSKCTGGKLVKREDGKVLKPMNYQPLDLSPILEA